MNCFGGGSETLSRDEVRRRKLRREEAKSAPVRKLQVQPESRHMTDPISTSDPGIENVDNLSFSFKKEPRELREFTHTELKLATNKFAPQNLLGEGGFGKVYKGVIRHKSLFHSGEDVMEVAVKQLNSRSAQGHNEWLAEVHFLAVADNPYLVRLVGYCSENDEGIGMQRLLVYEYMPNKSLDEHIFRLTPPILPWVTRVKIALGAARGLAYLHEEITPQVILRDFKTSNVLLDDDFNPKLSDFGLARQGPDIDKSHVTTGVKGTFGYAAPEYVQTGHLTYKSDVWSFGMVMLEMLTGRIALDWNRPKNEQRLLEWVKPYIRDFRRFQMVIDPKLEGCYPKKEALRFSSLAMKCIEVQPKGRPKMSEVVDELNKVLELTYLSAPPTLQSTGCRANMRCVTDGRRDGVTQGMISPQIRPRTPTHAPDVKLIREKRLSSPMNWTKRQQAPSTPSRKEINTITKKAKASGRFSWLPKLTWF